MAMARTCHNMTDRIQSHIRRRFKHCVSPFIDDSHRFREKLRECSAAIGGSVAMNMIMPASSSSRVMAVHVQLGSHGLESYLMAHEGYKPFRFDPALGGNPWTSGPHPWSAAPSPIRSVTTLQRPSDAEEDEFPRTINIVMSNDQSPLTPFFNTNATSTMNWVTADSVNIAYPRMTLNKIGIMCSSEGGVGTSRPSWMGSDFTLIHHMDQRDEEKRCGEFCVARFRSTMDSWTLRLAFNGGLMKLKENVRPRQWLLRGRALEGCENPRCDSHNIRLSVAKVITM